MENPFEEILIKLNAIERVLHQNYNNQKVINNMEKVKFLNINEAANFLKVKVPTIYKKVQQQSIPYIKKSGKLLFEEAELISWLKASKRKSEDQIKNDVDNYLKGGKLCD